jgi:hypothetical protein
MLVNYIRVFQQSGAPSNIVGQSNGNANLTGAGGPGKTNGSDTVGIAWGLTSLLTFVLGIYNLFV